MCPKCNGYILEDRDETDVSKHSTVNLGMVAYCVNCGKRLYEKPPLRMKVWTWRKGYVDEARV